MNKVELILNDEKLLVNGYITFDNIEKTITFFEEKTKNINLIEIDLKNLYNSNSAALLFIINCIRYSMKTKKKLYFLNVSEILLDLSKVYNLNDIINEKIKKEKK
ncbi:MAG TPA: STAS domain-containing protein [Candidatus Azoamicus sp.]